MLTSSAELSHCEQRAQSLFTNQLSSAPGLRESSLCIRSVTPMLGGFSSKTDYFLSQRLTYHPPVSVSPSFICISSKLQCFLWLLWQLSRRWLCGNPWQCDFYLKSQISTPGTHTAPDMKGKSCGCSHTPVIGNARLS